MLADLLAVLVEDRPVTQFDLLCEPAAGVPVGDEADVVGVGLLGHGDAAFGGFGPYLVLGRGGTEREHRVLQLIGVEHAEDIGLILCPGRGAVELMPAVAVVDHRGVVAGAHRIEAERDGLVQESFEFDLLVAAHTGIGRPARGILTDEVVDDVCFEPLREVPHVEGDPELLTCPPGVGGVLDGAAAATSRAQRPGHARERQMHADDVVACLYSARGRDSGIHSATHRCQDLHRDHLSFALLAHTDRLYCVLGLIASTDGRACAQRTRSHHSAQVSVRRSVRGVRPPAQSRPEALSRM